VTAPTRLNPEEQQLEWQKTDQAQTQAYNKQLSQDVISPTAAQLTDQPYYNQINIIRQNSTSATQGAIQAEANVQARNSALAAQKMERERAAAMAKAAADGQAYGQNDPSFGALNYDGGDGSAGWGSGGAQGLANVLRQAGFPESAIPTMMAIAQGESSWNPNATHSNPNGTVDQGLWQINSMHKGNSWYPTNPFDPLQNARAAYALYQGRGGGFQDWVVYNNGTYKQYLPSSVPSAQATAFNGGNYGPANYNGLASNTLAARSFIQKTFGISNIGGFGGGSVAGSDHPKGKALDVMIPNYSSSQGIAKGNQVAQWFISNPAAYGIKYVIWRDRIWQNGVWKPYGHPTMHNDTGQHRDHVHLSFV
jgi:hypothetical protein